MSKENFIKALFDQYFLILDESLIISLQSDRFCQLAQYRTKIPSKLVISGFLSPRYSCTIMRLKMKFGRCLGYWLETCVSHSFGKPVASLAEKMNVKVIYSSGPRSRQESRLSEVVDRLNQQFGRETVTCGMVGQNTSLAHSV